MSENMPAPSANRVQNEMQSNWHESRRRRRHSRSGAWIGGGVLPPLIGGATLLASVLTERPRQ